MKLSQSNEMLKHQLYQLEKQLFSAVKNTTSTDTQKSTKIRELEAVLEELQKNKKLNNDYIISLECSLDRVSTGLAQSIDKRVLKSSQSVKPFFDANFYAQRYNVPKKLSMLHYSLKGRNNGNNISPYFDLEYVQKIVKTENLSAYSYFTTARCFFIKPNEFFDPWWYRNEYSDVKDSGIDPLLHYINFGWRESRNPSKKFSSRAYLESHNDVRQAGVDPLAHYLTVGREEHRQIFSL